MIFQIDLNNVTHQGGLMARPISAEEEDLKQIDLLPRMHITADLSKGKARMQRIQDMVVP